MNRTALVVIIAFFLSACATGAGMTQSEVKRITPDELAKLMLQPEATYTLEAIVTDAKSGKTPGEMIAKIKSSESLYGLSASDVLRLNQQGVDVEVLDYMLESNALAKQNYLAEEINKREHEKEKALKALNNERLLQMNRYYDPFWRPYGYYQNHIPIGPASRF
jgi:hypothetical protein